jgi:hypothetical protein
VGAPQDLIAGRYRLQRRIAAGGMGVVWEARDELLQRPVAVKQLRLQSGITEDETELAKQRAMREARITARLHHPHAVPVFDAVEHDGEPCLVMQYVPSEPLSALIKRRGPLPVGEVARIGAEVASALAAAHALGIVHRDVKPGNILIADADGSALLSDFGISHALGDATLTSTGFVHGTPAYLAPEVARGDESTFASDVFSLGSTLYAASEGRAPFGEDPNSIAVLHRVASGGFQAPKDSGPLGPLLLQMMASDPEARPTMRETARRLVAVQEQAGEDVVPTLQLVSDAAPEEEAAFDDPDAPTAWVPVAGDATSTLVAQTVPAPEPVEPALAPEPVEAEVQAELEPVEPEPEPESEELAAAPVAAAAALGATATTVRSAGAADRTTAPLEAPTRPSPTLLAPTRTAEPVAPRPADPPVAEPASPPPARRRRRGALLGVLAAIVVLALGGFGLVRALQPPGRADPTQSAPAAAASRSVAASPTTPASSPAPSPSITPSSTPAPTSPAPTSAAPSRTTTPSRTTAPAPAPAAAATPVATIQRYYTLVPRNTSAAWPLLTANYQTNHAGGRRGFDSFWAPVQSVSATNVRQIGTNLVRATLTYRRSSGTSVEVTTFRLVNEGGVLKIADSSVD